MYAREIKVLILLILNKDRKNVRTAFNSVSKQ